MQRILFLSLVWIAVIFGPKSACSMAVDSQTDDSGNEVHHRARRAVLSSHQVMVTAVPYLTTSYYFNRNELITFKIRMSCNGTALTDYTNLKLSITSDWIDMSLGSVTPDMFTTGTLAGSTIELTKDTLKSNDVIIGNISGVVKDTIEPLATLELKLLLEGTQGADTIAAEEYFTSSPTVYGVFPEVNTTGKPEEPQEVYSVLNMDMKVLLPEIESSLVMELTTNIEDFIFMGIKGVAVSKGAGITATGAGTPQYYSQEGNGENDRVEMDFGNITVPENTPRKEREVTVSFDVQINDHDLLENGTKHYFGAGIQVGTKVLWVEQYDVTILKTEPALTVTASSDQTQNNTRLYIGDKVTFDVTIEHHENTSTADASNIRIAIITDYLDDSSITQVGCTRSGLIVGANYTTYIFSLDANSLTLGNTVTVQIKMAVVDTVTPLLSIKADIEILYKNPANPREKRPVKTEVVGLMTATPIIDFQAIGNTTIRAGQKVDFSLDILLVQMNSPLEIELVMPKANNEPIMSITDFHIKQIGTNLVGVDTNAKATNTSTTGMTLLPDQATWNLGFVKNPSNGALSDSNKIQLRFTAYLNDFENVTDGAKYWVGAGVIGRPKMVWVGQIEVQAEVAPTAPAVAINMTHSADTDEYNYEISFKHSDISSRIAYNLTFEYYLPPYVEYVDDVTVPAEVTKVSGTRYKFYREMFYFNDAVEHSIKVRLNRDKSPKTGKFNFVVPVRVSFQDRMGEWKEYFRAANRSIEVLKKGPTIPRDSNAKEHYYGRGFYWNKNDNTEFYVCMNQHVPTATPACYRLHADLQHFIALDRRIGCVLGHAPDSKLYGLARNQITAMVFDNAAQDWFPIPDNELPLKTSFAGGFKDLTGANSLGVVSSPSADHEETLNTDKWQGTGDGLYFKPSNSDWTLKAKWVV